MVGSDIGCCVMCGIFVFEFGGVFVDGFVYFFGGGNFFYDFFIGVQYIGIVYYFGQIVDVGLLEYIFNCGSVNYCFCCFKGGGGDVGRSIKMKFEFGGVCVVDYVVYVIYVEYIGNFVWVGNGGNCVMLKCNLGKFIRYEYGVFDMDMCVDEIW